MFVFLTVIVILARDPYNVDPLFVTVEITCEYSVLYVFDGITLYLLHFCLTFIYYFTVYSISVFLIIFLVLVFDLLYSI